MQKTTWLYKYEVLLTRIKNGRAITSCYGEGDLRTMWSHAAEIARRGFKRVSIARVAQCPRCRNLNYDVDSDAGLDLAMPCDACKGGRLRPAPRIFKFPSV